MLCTTADAVRIYRVPAGTIRRWNSEGRLINHGSSSRALWDAGSLSELHQWSNKRRVQPGTVQVRTRRLAGLVAIGDAADAFGLSPRTLRHRVAAAHLRNYGTPARPRYRADQIEPLGRAGYMPRLPVALSDLIAPAHVANHGRIPAA